MVPFEQVEVLTGGGIVGDRYETSRHRHVTVQVLADLLAASDKFGATIEPQHTRRNITIDEGVLDKTPGARIRVGGLELEVVRQAAPCKLLDDVIGQGAARALSGRAGVVYRVLRGGSLRVGDEVCLSLDG